MMKLPPPMDGRKPLEPWPCIYSSEITIIPLGQKSIIHRHHPGGFFVKTGGSSCSQSSQPGQTKSTSYEKKTLPTSTPLACWKLLGRVVKKRKLSFFQFFPPCFFPKSGAAMYNSQVLFWFLLRKQWCSKLPFSGVFDVSFREETSFIQI